MNNIENYVLFSIVANNEIYKSMPLVEEDFTSEEALVKFQIIRDTIAKDWFIDLVLLAKKLIDQWHDPNIADMIPDNLCETSWVADMYFKELRATTIKRKTREIMKKGVELWLSDDDIKERLLDIDKLKPSRSVSWSDMIANYLEEFDKRKEWKMFFRTWFDEFDEKVWMEKGWLVTLMARTSMGKSALAMNYAINMAKAWYNVLFFSLEMSTNEYLNRVFWSISWMNNARWKHGNVDEEIKSKTLKEFEEISDKLTIEYKSSFTSDDIVRSIRSRPQTDIVILDYLGLLWDQERKGQTKTMMIWEQTKKFKNVAVEEEVLFMQLSQVRRNINDIPTLDDARDSWSIEQDSEVVMCVHRKERTSEEGILRILKNRHWSCWDIDLNYNPWSCLFTEKRRLQTKDVHYLNQQ